MRAHGLMGPSMPMPVSPGPEGDSGPAGGGADGIHSQFCLSNMYSKYRA